ncbi:hypothetical protein ABIB75_005310 [Bradyrhizobium sp. GM2.2]
MEDRKVVGDAPHQYLELAERYRKVIETAKDTFTRYHLEAMERSYRTWLKASGRSGSLALWWTPGASWAIATKQNRPMRLVPSVDTLAFATCSVRTKSLDLSQGRHKTENGALSTTAYFGDCRPGEVSQSLMCAPVLANRAFLRRASRSAPAGNVLACSLYLVASSSNRSSREWVCFTLRRSVMALSSGG